MVYRAITYRKPGWYIIHYDKNGHRQVMFHDGSFQSARHTARSLAKSTGYGVHIAKEQGIEIPD